MKCPDCLGYGYFYRHDIVMDDNDENPVLGSVTKEPCRTCGGCGFTQCCEGEPFEVVGPGEVGVSGVTNLSKNPVRIFHQKEEENGLEQVQRTADYPETGSG